MGGGATASENINTDVSIEPSLTVTIPSTPLVLNLDPSSVTSGSNNLTITVGTNNATGYKTIMTSQSGDTNLTETTDTTLTIPTLASGSYSSPSDFPANHWGYKKDSGSYIPFATNTTILESDTYANDDTTTLSFATKIDYLQASGTYKTTLVFTTTVNPNYPYIQNLNPTLCTTTPLTVIDKRDGEEYTVQRLADGNCWLLDNLRLDISDPAVQAKLNSTTTNATDTVLGYLKNGGGTSPYAINGVSNVFYSDYTSPYIDTQYKNTIQPASGPSPAGKIGIYYNFCAVSAGSYCYALNAGTGNAQYDICPAGWRMPTGGASGEYQALYTAYGDNISNVQAALNTPLSGTPTGDRGTNGYFWASTYSNGSSMRLLLTNANTSVDYPQYDHGRAVGASARCVLNDTRTISDITYMQDITPGIVSRTANNATATLTDKRDNQQYAVTKINGNVWMTRNLAIGCNGVGSTYGSTITPIELTPNGTNISFNYTTPTTRADSGYDVTTPRMSCSNTYGAWYNVVAASAGTITGLNPSSYTFWATENICPAGWTLPNIIQANGISSSTPYYNLYSPTLGGYYTSGSYSRETVASYWWINTTTGRNCLGYNSGADYVNSQCSTSLGDAVYVRCVAK